MFVIDLDRRHVTRPGTGGEQNARRMQHGAVSVQTLHFDTIGVQQRTAAADQRHLIARELSLQISILGCDHRLDALEQRGERRIAPSSTAREEALPRIRR